MGNKHQTFLLGNIQPPDDGTKEKLTGTKTGSVGKTPPLKLGITLKSAQYATIKSRQALDQVGQMKDHQVYTSLRNCVASGSCTSSKKGLP